MKKKKATLEKGLVYGKFAGVEDATFLGWKKLRGKERVMEGRWSNGRVIYVSQERGVYAWDESDSTRHP